MQESTTLFSPEFIEKIANDLVFKSLKVQPKERVFLSYHYQGTALARRITELILELGAYVDYHLRDYRMENLITAKSELPFVKQPDPYMLARIQRADCYLSIGCEEDYERLEIDKERRLWQNTGQRAMRDEIVDEERTRRCVAYLPSRKQAKQDNMSFEEYVEVYFNACNLPWDEIRDAQTKLIEKFNPAKKLVIEADINNPDPKKRTHLTMDIEGMTFANSHIQKNYPGAELFSAPKLYGTNGTFFSPGRFFKEGKLIRDIYFEIKDGKIVDADASEGKSHLIEILDTDEGSRFLGEIGIGTNPGLTADVSDSLLFEKKGGSFHIAVGNPYKIRVYEGKPICTNNGGNSNIHWDITNMLSRPGGSKMILDGEIVQENGKWMSDNIEVLNPKI